MQARTYECAIIGGGLAGLCLAIQLADHGISVVLFEKNQYPFHKVCGEYISMESHHFLGRLGLPFEDLNLPVINQLGISSEKGFMLNAPLQTGGFGISRYSLDSRLCDIAVEKGVTILQNCRVSDVNVAEKETTMWKRITEVSRLKSFVGAMANIHLSFWAKTMWMFTNHLVPATLLE
jgi:flavin-dependent dehydrogenase